MIEIGKYNKLVVKNFTDFGLYLGEEESETDKTILLPKREIPEDTKVGDILNVFIYKDSEDRDIATTSEVPFEVGGLALLTVTDIAPIGAFLDWGLMKDLFLPFKEQTTTLEVGDEILVSLYVDKSSRLCATMKLYDVLLEGAPYEKDENVTGIIYEIIENFGAFVAVDNKYSAMIPNQELFRAIKVGDVIEGRVIEIRPDGKLTLSLRQKAYIQLDSDAVLIMKMLEEADGQLPYHDKTDPETIKSTFHISKSAFKRAIGRLYKAGAITIENDGIKKVPNK